MRPLRPIAATLCAIALIGGGIDRRVTQAAIGPFGTPTSIDLQGSDIAGRVVLDFNQDRRLDVVVTVNGATTTNIKRLSGDGTGAFAHASGLLFGDAGAIAAADFNRDGAPDIAVAQNLVAKPASGYSDAICGSILGVALFFGPDMTAARCLATISSPAAIQTGDFDRDGRTDIAVASANAAGLLIYRQIDTVSHVSATVPGGQVRATSMAAPADLNGDGFLDLVIGHATGVTAFLGKGDGTFALGGSVASGDRVQAVAVGRLDGDGVPDVAFVQATAGGLIGAFGNGNGTFRAQPIATIGTDLTDVAIADLDADRAMDVVVAHRAGGVVRIFEGHGDGTFTAHTPVMLGSRPKFLVVADVDGDGDLDLGTLDSGAIGQNARLWMALQNGTGTVDTIPPSVQLTAPGANAVLASTVNLTASASDASGIDRVEFYAGAALVAADNTSPYGVAWNTTTVPNGTYVLTGRAYDTAGNSAASAGVSVRVSNSTSTELIVSGGFEPTVTGWTKSGAAFFSTGGVQHRGVGYAYLAKANSVTGSLQQQLSIPAGSASSLSFWLNITTAETGSTANDQLFVEVLSTTGSILATIATYSNLNGGATGSYVLRSGFSLAPYAGQTVILRFRAATDAVNVTAFRIDDVSVSTSGSAPPAAELIISGSFEPTVTAWTRSGTAFFSTGGVQHTGIGYAYLAKANAVSGSLSQTISIPPGATPSLSFWLNVTSDEPSTSVASDRLFVEVLNGSGAVLSTLATYSNLDKGALGAYVLKSNFSLSAYTGQTVQLRFRATTNAANVTAFRIDDVSVK